MSPASLSLLVTAGALFLGVAWASAAVLLPAWSRAAAALPALARGALVAAALPWLVGLSVALAALLPGDPHLGQVLGCHCLDSKPAWVHLCPVHPEEAALLAVPSAVLLALLLPGRLRAVAELAREPVGRGGGGEPRVLGLGVPMALLHGWLRPTLVVDRRLWDALSADERSAVLAHERGHLRRRDPALRMVLRALLVIAPRSAAAQAARTWLDHAELRADAEAARLLADPTLVARALVRCARLGAQSPEMAVAWTGGRLDRRVHALVASRALSAPARPDVGPADLAVLAGLAALALLATPWVHHQVEHLLNLPL